MIFDQFVSTAVNNVLSYLNYFNMLFIFLVCNSSFTSFLDYEQSLLFTFAVRRA